jgi:hypothetical protein
MSSFGEILMRTQEHVYPLPAEMNSASADAVLLLTMLRQFVPTPKQGGPVSDIALIFCRNWVCGNLFGLMFDYDGQDPQAGFLTSKAPGDTIGVPREGCAVFLDALSSESTAHQVHTAIHELGHVFNLHHDLANASFMGTTCWDNGFNQNDQELLTNAGSGVTPTDLPGGSNFVAYDGGGAAMVHRGVQSGQRPRNPRLRLSVSVDSREYLIGETIVLDVQLMPAGKAKVLLPDHLDPGHDAFRIWIETPEGERFLHRPPFRFCPAPGQQVEVSHSSPLKNNLRITRGADGLNFRVPGEYRTWAEYRPPHSSGQRPLLSPRETIRVRKPATTAETLLAQLLMAPDIAFFVAHGGGPIRKDRRHQLQQAIKRHREHPAARHIRYSLAKDMIRNGRMKSADRLLAGLEFSQPSLRRGLKRLQARISNS